MFIVSDPELERILRKKFEGMAKGGTEKVSAGSVILSSENFDIILNGEKPSIVDFWAEWCAPCRFMHPVFEKLSAKYAGKMIFGRLNVDEYPDISSRYSVYSIPTFLIFRGGKPAEAVIGAVGEKGLEQAILKHLP